MEAKKSLFLLSLLFLFSCNGTPTSMEIKKVVEGNVPLKRGLLDPGTYTFEDDIKPIFEAECSLCHRPGIPSMPDWTNYDIAKDKSERIGERLFVSQDMPADDPGSIVGYEKALIEYWIEQGAPKSFSVSSEAIEKAILENY